MPRRSPASSFVRLSSRLPLPESWRPCPTRRAWGARQAPLLGDIFALLRSAPSARLKIGTRASARSLAPPSYSLRTQHRAQGLALCWSPASPSLLATTPGARPAALYKLSPHPCLHPTPQGARVSRQGTREAATAGASWRACARRYALRHAPVQDPVFAKRGARPAITPRPRGCVAAYARPLDARSFLPVPCDAPAMAVRPHGSPQADQPVGDSAMQGTAPCGRGPPPLAAPSPGRTGTACSEPTQLQVRDSRLPFLGPRCIRAACPDGGPEGLLSDARGGAFWAGLASLLECLRAKAQAPSAPSAMHLIYSKREYSALPPALRATALRSQNRHEAPCWHVRTHTGSMLVLGLVTQWGNQEDCNQEHKCNNPVKNSMLFSPLFLRCSWPLLPGSGAEHSPPRPGEE